MTVAFGGLAAAVWLVVSMLGAEQLAILWGGFFPVRLNGVAGDEMLAPAFLTPLTSTFLHGGWIHLGFNLLMLAVCGRPVEGIIGLRGMLILILIGTYAAAGAQYAVDPESNVPMVGASGAISAIIGAYALLFGRNRVRVADERLALWLNAAWLMAAWVGLQLLIGLTFNSGIGGIAIAAHIGGFLAGLALARPLLLLRYRNA